MEALKVTCTETNTHIEASYKVRKTGDMVRFLVSVRRESAQEMAIGNGRSGRKLLSGVRIIWRICFICSGVVPKILTLSFPRNGINVFATTWQAGFTFGRTR